MNAHAKPAPRIGWPAWTANNRRRRAMVSRLSQLSGLPVDDLETVVKRDIIAVYTGGNDSSKALDARGWLQLYTELQARLDLHESTAPVVHNPRPPQRIRNADALSSAEQRRVVETLRQLNAMSADEFHTFCIDRLGCKSPATRAQANKIINALKPMALRRHQVEQRVCRALLLDLLDPRDRELLADVSGRFDRGRQGASVRVGSIPILLKVFARYHVERRDD